MKKLFLFALLIVAAISANAQAYLGGSLGVWRNSDAETTTVTIAPEVGYNLSEQWAIGVALDYTHGKVDKLSANSFAIAPYARFTYYENGMVRLFVDGGFGVSTYKYTGSDSVTGEEIGLKPGISLKLSDKFNFVAKCGFLGWRDDYSLASDGYGLMLSSEDLTFGFHYEF
jgi:hypothetical protein